MKNKISLMKIDLMPIIIIVLVISFLRITVAEPTTPVGPSNFTQLSTSSFNASLYTVKTNPAMAGNITQLSIRSASMTKSYQGYYGNITGDIFLQDALGFTFYNWSVVEPTGEIYASPNTTVSWLNIHCFNYSANGSSEINITTVESWFNISTYASDGIEITYNATSNPGFYVGTVSIGPNTCPTTYINQNSTPQSGNFPNMLLTDNSSLVFTTLIENTQLGNATDKMGYNGVNYDFQLLVAENGHTDFVSPTTTTYYFWVELD